MKTKLLKKLRRQAYDNLIFIGKWSGWWETEINGQRYKSGIVSGFKHIIGDYDEFIIDCIISTIHKLSKL